MGTTSKVCHVILRVWEIICSVIVLGLVAHFVNRINDAGVSNDSRVIYTLVVASFSTLYAIIFIPPIRYGFLGFPVDFCLFIMWMVAFGLLANVCLARPSLSTHIWLTHQHSEPSETHAARSGTGTIGGITGVDGGVTQSASTDQGLSAGRAARSGVLSWPSRSWYPSLIF